MRVACSHLAEPGLEGEALLASLAQAVGVLYNNSGSQECLSFKQVMHLRNGAQHYWRPCYHGLAFDKCMVTY